MVSGHYANIEQGTPLRSLLPADRFRTVSQETRDTVPLTPNEVAVTVVMKPAFVKRLHFPVPWDGILYGVVRKTELLRQLGTDEVYDLLENCLRIPEQTNENENPNLFI